MRNQMILFIAIFFVSVVTAYAGPLATHMLYNRLKKEAEETNKTLPNKLNDSFQMEIITVTKKNFNIHVNLYFKFLKSPVDSNTQARQARMESSIIPNACGDSSIRKNIRNGVIYNYIYHDTNNNILNSISVTDKQCYARN